MLSSPKKTVRRGRKAGLDSRALLKYLWLTLWVETGGAKLWAWSQAAFLNLSKECRDGLLPLPNLPVGLPCLCVYPDVLDNTKSVSHGCEPHSAAPVQKRWMCLIWSVHMFLLPPASLVTAFSTRSLNPSPINPFQVPPSIVLPIPQELSEIPWHMHALFPFSHCKKPYHGCYVRLPLSLLTFARVGMCVFVCVVAVGVVSEKTGGADNSYSDFIARFICRSNPCPLAK